jgi:hypothetical protein
MVMGGSVLEMEACWPSGVDLRAWALTRRMLPSRPTGETSCRRTAMQVGGALLGYRNARLARVPCFCSRKEGQTAPPQRLSRDALHCMT